MSARASAQDLAEQLDRLVDLEFRDDQVVNVESADPNRSSYTLNQGV